MIPEERPAALEVTVTSPVRPNETATATVSAPAGSVCSIEVTYSSGASVAAGLGDKVVDDTGSVSWSWTVGTRTKPGEWTVEVRCQQPDHEVRTGHAPLKVEPAEADLGPPQAR